MKKTLAIMLALIMVLALVPSVAFAEEPKKIYVDATNGNDTQDGVGTASDKAYKSLDKAMEAAVSGDTIYLAAGTYCGNSANPSQAGNGAKKNLTFVGAGPDQTTWQIRATEQYGADGWCDYSFKDSDSITFENMTVVGSVYSDGIKANDTQGLTYINHLTLKNCIFNGRADYWGYETTTFENVTFNAPGTTDSGIAKTDYSLWTKTGRTYKFDHCTFKASGKVINAYREGTVGTAKNPLVLNFKDCKVVSSDANKSVLNIKDANNYYLVNISGINTVEGLEPNKRTCSRLFQVEGWANDYNLSGGTSNGEKCQATVTIDGKTVWQDGRMVSHAIDTTNDKYTDGYKDNAFEIIKDTTTGVYVKKCKHCGYTEPFYGELSNDIKLERTVKQGQKVEIETTNPKDTYKVNGSSGIAVDYTATMDMSELVWQVGDERYDKDNKYTYTNPSVSPWELLMARPGQITEDTVVFLTFKFDDKINLGEFEKKYDEVTNKADVLKLESNMFEIADDGVQFNTTNNTMTITCKWKLRTITDTPDPKITLYGFGLPVEANWGESKQINIENRGCVKGMVHINPRGGAAVAMVGPAPNVAANQESIPTPSLDTIQIPIVGGCAADNFTLYYGGGSSGDDHNHYYPTTTPVPVIVIPPKTGDMTIWQSILSFLGIK